MFDEAVYDAIVLGGGPSGLSCAAVLGRRGFRVLVLEQWAEVRDKVCGDGLSVFCVPQLARLGIGVEDLRKLGACPVFHKREYRNGEERIVDYKEPCFGLPRPQLMKALIGKALEQKARIQFGTKVEKIEKPGDIYVINDQFAGKNVINAMGAVSFLRPKEIRDLPFGVSARIKGRPQGIEPNTFYFYYAPEYGNGYAWIFPIGDELWNVGVWNGDLRQQVMDTYRRFEASLFGEGRLVGYDRAPGGAFIGASFREFHPELPTLGDAAYIASYSSGEGITFALQSAIDFAETLLP